MGKVAKPLTIVVFPPLDEWPEIVKLEKQGHTIIRTNTVEFQEGVSAAERFATADIIMGPHCWMMTELHRKHLTQAIKQSRLRRYGTITKKRKKGDDNEKTEEHTDPSSTDSESSGC